MHEEVNQRSMVLKFHGDRGVIREKMFKELLDEEWGLQRKEIEKH